MATDEETIKRRYREFVDLLPLTISLAGLPASEGAVNFSPDQLELRTHTLATAFRLARQLLRDAVANNP